MVGGGIDTKAALDIAASIIGLLGKSMELGLIARKRKAAPAANREIDRILMRAKETADSTIQRLEALRQRLVKEGVDLKSTVSDLQGSTDWWRFRRYFAVRDFELQLLPLIGSVSGGIEDALALARCMEAEDLIAESYGAASKMSGDLEHKVRSDMSIGDILDTLLEAARNVRDRLNDL